METSQTLGSDYVDMSDAGILARLEAEGGELNYDDSFRVGRDQKRTRRRPGLITQTTI